MENNQEFKNAFDMLVVIDQRLSDIKKLAIVEATVSVTDLVRQITEGKGEFADLRHDTKIALSFYVMGFQRSLLK